MHIHNWTSHALLNHSEPKKSKTLLLDAEKKKENDAYEMLAEIIEKSHLDNMKVLRALISTNEDEPPLFEGSTKRMV